MQFSQSWTNKMKNKRMTYTFGPQQKHPKADNNYLNILVLSVQICNVTDKDYDQSKKISETFTFYLTFKFERTNGNSFNGYVFFSMQ